MSNFDWPEQFRRCYDKAVTAYSQGNRRLDTYFTAPERVFLDSIGCSVQEIFDFAEDWCTGQEPSFSTVLLITAVRRDYFLVIQRGQPSLRQIETEHLPPKDAAIGGLPWLPRIIEKARAKLRGELPSDLMYCCGGDRRFLRQVNTHPADFLRAVWAAGNDAEHIINYVRKSSPTALV